jgi:PAS domain-containing protein
VAVAAPSSGTITAYKAHYKRTLIGLLISSQLIISIGAGLVMLATKLFIWQDPTFWMVILVIFLLGLGTIVVMMPIIIEPLYELLAALMHKVGEPSTTTPPNPNAKRYEKTGFKTALEAIYDCPKEESASTPAHKVVDQEHILIQALNHTSCGVVVLDPQKNIISANKAAPIAQTPDGTSYLLLILQTSNLSLSG